jgi:hypothetical protein
VIFRKLTVVINDTIRIWGGVSLRCYWFVGLTDAVPRGCGHHAITADKSNGVERCHVAPAEFCGDKRDVEGGGWRNEGPEDVELMEERAARGGRASKDTKK